MIKQSLLTKKVKSTRTYKYKIVGNTSYLDKQFEKIQTCRRLYFNYALQYLYQHYGVKHLMKIARKSPDFNPGMDRVDL